MLKPLLLGFMVLALLMVLGLVAYGATQGGGPTVWILAAVWTVALVLVPLVVVRSLTP